MCPREHYARDSSWGLKSLDIQKPAIFHFLHFKNQSSHCSIWGIIKHGKSGLSSLKFREVEINSITHNGCGNWYSIVANHVGYELLSLHLNSHWVEEWHAWGKSLYSPSQLSLSIWGSGNWSTLHGCCETIMRNKVHVGGRGMDKRMIIIYQIFYAVFELLLPAFQIWIIVFEMNSFSLKRIHCPFLLISVFSAFSFIFLWLIIHLELKFIVDIHLKHFSLRYFDFFRPLCWEWNTNWLHYLDIIIKSNSKC